MSFHEIGARWRQLDPVFVRGMQRSGTSVMARALRKTGIVGFGEGHLWFDLIKPFDKLRDPSYFPNYREDSYALGQGRVSRLEKYIAVALDQFHRDHLSSDLIRWMDKSPGADAVRVTPLLGRLFPRAQFIFMFRNGITTVYSAVNFWPDYPEIFKVVCRAWAETMSTWREVRKSLHERYIEIAQEDVASRPFETAMRLTDFLEVPECCHPVADLFRSKRVLSAFPEKAPRDYDYQVDWSPEQKAHFAETCREEMEMWGYEIDFGSSEGEYHMSSLLDDQAAIMEAFSERDARIAKLENECEALREHLAMVEQGRVMRLLNWLHRWKSRLLRQEY